MTKSLDIKWQDAALVAALGLTTAVAIKVFLGGNGNGHGHGPPRMRGPPAGYYPPEMMGPPPGSIPPGAIPYMGGMPQQKYPPQLPPQQQPQAPTEQQLTRNTGQRYVLPAGAQSVPDEYEIVPDNDIHNRRGVRYAGTPG